MDAIFTDRAGAGRVLAGRLARYAGRDDVLVLALPRGGVPVAAEVAAALHAPLDVFLVRKLGVPGREEMAMGALASGGVRVINNEIVDTLNIPPEIIEAVTQRETAELARRDREYRAGRPPPRIAGRTVIVIDDGLATGASMRAALEALRAMRPARLIAAAPVGAEETCLELQQLADEVACAATPQPFYGVGMWYQHFSQVTDDEVKTILARAQRDHGSPSGRAAGDDPARPAPPRGRVA